MHFQFKTTIKKFVGFNMKKVEKKKLKIALKTFIHDQESNMEKRTSEKINHKTTNHELYILI